LYLTGAATFPGAGVWGASGRNAALTIIKEMT
jgi:phytoene dehydrogenase-like protein